jgi:class 3 adenylate cyclase
MTDGTPPGESASATAERRLVSALFADVVGPTSRLIDDPRTGTVMCRVIALMTVAAERNGGSVVRVAGDGCWRSSSAHARGRRDLGRLRGSKWSRRLPKPVSCDATAVMSCRSASASILAWR